MAHLCGPGLGYSRVQKEETVSPLEVMNEHLLCGSPFSLDIGDLGVVRMIPGAKHIHINKQVAETPTGAV